MICDPFTFPAGDLMAHLNQHVRGAVVMGGMASGGLAQRRSLLFRDDRVLTGGAVGAHLPGRRGPPLVAQGCRPVGDPYTVTRADGSLIFELGGRPPLARLRETGRDAARSRSRNCWRPGRTWAWSSTSTRPRPGWATSWSAASSAPIPRRGRWPWRAMSRWGRPCSSTCGMPVRPMMICDGSWSGRPAGLGGRPPAGALLFTCTGRGSRMFPGPDHDAGLLAETLGPLPVAGFFCDGELGPVGGQNFLHTFTASIALFPGAAG